jgi:hypothetical protein
MFNGDGYHDPVGHQVFYSTVTRTWPSGEDIAASWT